MRRTLAAFSILLLCCVLPLAAEAPQKPRVKLGVIIPLSGVLAEYGGAVRTAIELAREAQPTQFNSVELVFEDSKSDTAAAVSAMEKLVSTDRVGAVFVWGATAADALAPIAHARKIPLIGVTANPVTAKGRPTILRASCSARELVLPLAHHLAVAGVKHIALLKAEWTYTALLTEALHAELGAGVKIEEFAFARDIFDFRSALTRIQAGKPDWVGVYLGTGQISALYKQLAALHIEAKTFGTEFFGSNKERSDSGAAINGAVFPAMKVCPEFNALFAKRNGADTHVAYALITYDTFAAIGAAADAVSAPDQFFAELKRPRSMKGICGPVEAHDGAEYGAYFDFPVALYQVDGAAVREVAK